jgi:hypothetical protein
MTKIEQIQEILGVAIDNRWGPKSQAALDAAIAASRMPVAEPDGWHEGKASSFADPADIRAFERCKRQGKSDQECFKVGDNGIGKWGDSTVQGTGPSCALPPEDWERWVTPRGLKVIVECGDRAVECLLKDTMPRKANNGNGAIIDLNPDAAKALGLKPPFMVPVKWRWT